jgi:hypothetical protein
MPAPSPEPAAHGDTYILGSGPSLTRLDDAQRRFLDAQPFVFAMNKYLLYWDRIGVHPSHFFLADTHFPAYLVLQRSVRRASELRRAPLFCLHRDYARFVNAPLGTRMRALPAMARLLWRARGTPVHFLSVPEVLFFDSGITNDLPLVWARSLDEPLYFYRGSLSVLLNLATILNPGRPIHLLGVDMNTPAAFYEDAVARERRLHDRYRAIGEREGVHPTVAAIDGIPGILHRWDFMARSCAEAGCPIDNANPQSLLVQRGLCPHNALPSAS